MAFLLSAENNQEELVKRITKKLVNKVYGESYNSYVQDKEAFAVEFARELRDKKIHYDMCKTSLNTQVQEDNRKNYLFRYF